MNQFFRAIAMVLLTMSTVGASKKPPDVKPISVLILFQNEKVRDSQWSQSWPTQFTITQREKLGQRLITVELHDEKDFDSFKKWALKLNGVVTVEQNKNVGKLSTPTTKL
jgi:hypothetical protein